MATMENIDVNEIKYDIYKHTNKSEKLKDTVFLLGNGNIEFSKKIANSFKETYNCNVCYNTPSYFASGEVKLSPIKHNIRQKDIIIIQSVIDTYVTEENSLRIKKISVNDLLMETFIMIDAAKRGSAKSITVVLPMYPYQRQDRKDNSRTPISARVITTMLESLGISRVICFDLHAEQIQGFFGNTPVDNLFTEPYFIKYIKSVLTPDELQNTIIVSPDEGGLKRAVRVAKKIGLSTAFMYKERKVAGQVDNMTIMGDVNNKICIIVDDMIDTAGTACKAASILKENGASKIIMCACHGILSNNAIEKIEKSEFDKVCITNTVFSATNMLNYGIFNDLCYEEDDTIKNKIDMLDVSTYASLAIERCLLGYSLSELIDLKV